MSDTPTTPTPPGGDTPDTTRRGLYLSVPESLARRMGRYKADTRVTLSDQAADALDAYLTQKGY